MKCAELNKMLVDRFPNLHDKYLEEVSWQEYDNTGSHVVYGDVLTPYLKGCILKDQKQEFQVIFDFLEDLLGSGDEYIRLLYLKKSKGLLAVMSHQAF